tara:strand:- start:284 stop:805 length:522 start_codon:yes stop_codon:yes gene_type:complete
VIINYFIDLIKISKKLYKRKDYTFILYNLMDLEEEINVIDTRFERMEEILSKMEMRIESFDSRFEELEERLEGIELNMSPLLDLLNTLIKNNISVETVEEEPKQTEQKPELAYRVNEDNIYIYGTKTYDNRNAIKSVFKNASWSKENNAWTFKVFDKYEEMITKFFPNIVKGQ